MMCDDEETFFVQKLIEGFLFSIEEYCRMYPNLDMSKDNDKAIQEIRDALIGTPYYKEYTNDYIQAVKELILRYPNFKEYEEIFIPNEELLDLRKDKTINTRPPGQKHF